MVVDIIITLWPSLTLLGSYSGVLENNFNKPLKNKQNFTIAYLSTTEISTAKQFTKKDFALKDYASKHVLNLLKVRALI